MQQIDCGEQEEGCENASRTQTRKMRQRRMQSYVVSNMEESIRKCTKSRSWWH